MKSFTCHERAAVGVFLTDAGHRKDIEWKLEKMTDELPREKILKVVSFLEETSVLTQEEAAYLGRKIDRLYH